MTTKKKAAPEGGGVKTKLNYPKDDAKAAGAQGETSEPNGKPNGSGPDSGAVFLDKAAVHEFVGIIHGHAARLAEGIENPGVLQLICIYPDENEQVSVSRYRIGDVEGMTAVAVAAAETGSNVYIEARTVRSDLRGNVRGEIADTRFVFALVVDNDADTGLATKLDIRASLAVKSSPGNSHQWLLLDSLLSPEPAADFGRRLRAAAKADGATGKITQPYRVAGTPNFPNPRKRQRGRVTVPTFIAARTDRLWTSAELGAAFPEVVGPDADRSAPVVVDEWELTKIASALSALPNFPPRPVKEFYEITCALHYAADAAETSELAEKIHQLWDDWARQGAGAYKKGRLWGSLKGKTDDPNSCNVVLVRGAGGLGSRGMRGRHQCRHPRGGDRGPDRESRSRCWSGLRTRSSKASC